MLLAALGLGTDFALALAFVCAASAAAVLPVALVIATGATCVLALAVWHAQGRFLPSLSR